MVHPFVKIGLVGPFEGQYRYLGYDAIYAARLALREANGAGDVGGYNVQLVAYDDQGAVSAARAAARNLVLDTQVVAVIGHFRIETTQAAREVYERDGLPLVTAGMVEGEAGQEADLFCFLMDYLKDAVLSDKDDELSTYRVQWITDDDKTPACFDSRLVAMSGRMPPSSDIGAVLLNLDAVSAGETLAAFRRAGWNGIVAGGPALGSPLFTQIVDPSGVIFASPYRWPNTEGQDEGFSSAFRALGPHVPPPGVYALTTYQATKALLAAIEATVRNGQDLNRRNLVQHLNIPSSVTMYLYRWLAAEGPELIQQETVERNE